MAKSAQQFKPNQFNEFSDENEDKLKRKRKTKEEVMRSFECVVRYCDKSYGSSN